MLVDDSKGGTDLNHAELVKMGKMVKMGTAPISSNPSAASPISDNFDRAKQINVIGIRYIVSHNYGSAIDCFKQAVALDPENPIIYFNLGYAHMVHLILSVSYLKAGQFEEKIDALENALTLTKDPYLIGAIEELKELISLFNQRNNRFSSTAASLIEEEAGKG